MSEITHGVVSVQDGTKKAEEYTPARVVRVELTFDIPAGEDAETALAKVSALADGQVKRLLGGTVQTAVQPPLTAATAPAPEKPARKKAEGKPPPIQVVLKPETPADPTAVEVEEENFDAPAAEVKKISDDELRSSATRKNGEIKNPVAIRTLVASFAPAGAPSFQLIEIPQERRQEFLTKLGQLKAA